VVLGRVTTATVHVRYRQTNAGVSRQNFQTFAIVAVRIIITYHHHHHTFIVNKLSKTQLNM